MTYHQSLFDGVSAQLCIPPQDAAAVAKNGVTLDMRGWDSAEFVLTVGAVATSVDMKLQQGDASDGSDAADVAGAAITQLAGTDDNKIAILSVRPGSYTKRYLRVVVTPVGAVNLLGVVGIRHRRSGGLPVTQHADVKQIKEV